MEDTMRGSEGRAASPDFETLVRPHLDHLYRVAFRFTGSREDAEDLVQDLVVKLYPRRGELAAVEQLRPWLTQVLYRQFVDRYRKERRLKLLGGDRDEPRPGVVGEGFDAMASADPGPEAEADGRLGRARLERALAQLSREHRAVITLHDAEGYTLVELSRLLDVPTGTLKSRLHRARTRVRELLGGDSAAEPFADAPRVKGQDRGDWP